MVALGNTALLNKLLSCSVPYWACALPWVSGIVQRFAGIHDDHE
jgi:hypothetical protein